MRTHYAHELITRLSRTDWKANPRRILDHDTGEPITPENVSHLYIYQVTKINPDRRSGYLKRIPFNSIPICTK